MCAKAETELAAIEETRRYSPNLIVLGLPLPEAGLTLLVRELKKAAPNALIFLLTNKYDSVVEKRALSMGITGYFPNSMIMKLCFTMLADYSKRIALSPASRSRANRAGVTSSARRHLSNSLPES